MIRDYIPGDEAILKANCYSDYDDHVRTLCTNDHFVKKTLVTDDNVRAILIFNCFAERQYGASVLLCDNINTREIIEIKKFFNRMVKELKPLLVMACSEDCEVLNRWHKFIGFSKECAIDIHGKQYVKWVMQWE